LSNFFKIFFLLLLPLNVYSCSTKEISTSTNPEFYEAPSWVLSGKGNNDNFIYGVGTAVKTKDNITQVNIAKARARAEISRSIEVRVKSILTDYQSTIIKNDGTETAVWDEQKISYVTEQITASILTGTKHEESWISSSGTLYVLMSISIESLKDSIQKTELKSKEVSAFLESRVEQLK